LSRPLSQTLKYYDCNAVLDWLEEDFNIDRSELWVWLCENPITKVENGSYGDWWIDDWIEDEGYPEFVKEAGKIIKKELNIKAQYITVEYYW